VRSELVVDLYLGSLVYETLKSFSDGQSIVSIRLSASTDLFQVGLPARVVAGIQAVYLVHALLSGAVSFEGTVDVA